MDKEETHELINIIKDREIPKYLLNLKSNPSEEDLKEFVNFVLRDMETFHEFILFVNLLDRNGEKFSILSQSYHASCCRLQDRRYFDKCQELVDTKIENYIYSVLKEDVAELYKKAN